MGINKNQTGIVLPAGPVSTGPAGFAIVPVIDGGSGQPEQVAAAVEADKQREQAEKGRKRLRRSFDWGGR